MSTHPSFIPSNDTIALSQSVHRAPKYYLKRDAEYLHWTGFSFTDDEAGAWLGTSDHLDAFRPKHVLANATGVAAIRKAEG